MKVLFTIIGLLSSLYAHAIPLLQVSTEQGLSQASIENLIIDRHGMLWIGTAVGLNRYDGETITKVGGVNDLVGSAYINDVAIHSDGSIWVATYSNGLFRINNNSDDVQQILLHTISEKFGPSSIEEIHWLSDNTLLLGLEERVIEFNIETQTLTEIFALPDVFTDGNFVRALNHDEQSIYIATSAGFYAYDRQTQQSRQLLHSGRDIYHDSQNTKSIYVTDDDVWVGAVLGLYRIAKDSFQDIVSDEVPDIEIEEHLSTTNVWTITPDGDNFYLGTEQGLVWYSPHTKSFEVQLDYGDMPYGVNDSTVTAAVQDSRGNLWLGSRYNGAFYWNQDSKLFQNIGPRQGLSHNMVWGMVESADRESVWVATENGLNKVDQKTGKVEAFLQNEGKYAGIDNYIVNVVSDDKGTLYLFSDYGISAFDTASNQLVPIQLNSNTSIFEKAIWGAASDHQGNLWWLMEDGVYQFVPSLGIVQKNEVISNKLESSWSGTILPGRDGINEIFIALPRGIWRYDLDLHQIKLILELETRYQNELNTSSAYALDRNGLMWFTFGNYGVVAVDTDDWRIRNKLRAGQEIDASFYVGAESDVLGDHIWFTSHSGIYRYDVSTGRFSNFTVEDGTPANEFNTHATLRLSDGRLVFGSTNGLTLINPRLFNKTDDIEQNVHITGVSLLSRNFDDKTRIYDGHTLTFNHDDIGYRFDFSSMASHKHKSTVFIVNLMGPESVYYPNMTQNYVTFSTLDPGDYTFKVASIDLVTGNMSPERELRFVVAHAPWRSPLAYLIYVFLTCVLVGVWIRFRYKTQNKLRAEHFKALKNEERLQLALKGSNSEVWDWDSSSNEIYQKRLCDALGYANRGLHVRFETHCGLIHPDDLDGFVVEWESFISGGAARFQCQYRMQGFDGKYLWFSDLATASKVNDDGSVSRITGTYRNVTQLYIQEQNAKVFGEVFEQTKDAVLIFDGNSRVITANGACLTMFDMVLECIVGQSITEIAHAVSFEIKAEKINKKLFVDGVWRSETVLQTRTGKVPFLINASQVFDASKAPFFVVTLTDITVQKEAETNLRKLANFDHLTGLPNRTLLMDRLNHAVKIADRMPHQIALCFIDLDRFKPINDSLGHSKGDQLLIEIGQRLQHLMRPYDTVGRLGGDEFVLIIESLTSVDVIAKIVTKVIDTISEPVNLDIATVQVTPSVGIAVYPDDARNVTELLKAADIAMYHAKDSGRSCYRYYTPELTEHAQRRLVLENQIKEAQANDCFINYYQPIVDVMACKLVAVEVLMRWERDGVIAAPSDFIDVAEEIGCLEEMTRGAMDRALADLKLWQNVIPDLYISVNLSARHFEKSSLLYDIESSLKRHKISAKSISLEVTESVLLRDSDAARIIMERLQSMGLRIVLDDFGTGYSSLSYVHQLPLDGIKIDKGFVKHVGEDSRTTAIIDTILRLSRQLGIDSIAEGIETLDQAKILMALGCRLHQGYLFSEPVDAAQFNTFLESSPEEIGRILRSS
ncbi:EAL domain-containing protein [Echinimonas agarilytica]|uniref:EAL domain-containing protein n=1 Tax=Echinimonas agarilytica TaxID=1215918 RepID=A0AA41W8T7_9GAMM|nr:EAL domain-containing protein [Echinimonas agarilytica]